MEKSKLPTPRGDCFEAAARFIREVGIANPERYLLVHGNAAKLQQDEFVNHAWVEEGDIVHEVSNKRHLKFLKDEYYEKHRITNIRTYTLEQTLLLCLKHNHSGPWD
jgi:hypothetical protein